jgi:hypothetical protein
MGVTRLDRFETDAGVKLRSVGRIDADIFNVPGADLTTFEYVADLHSTQITNVSDINLTSGSSVYVGNVVADNVALDTGLVKIYGNLQVNGNFSVNDANAPPVSIEASDTLAAGGETGSVHYYRFSLSEQRQVRFAYMSPQGRITVVVFTDDGNLDTGDRIAGYLSPSYAYGWSTDTLAAGDYIVAVGAYNFDTTEAVNGINDVGGLSYELSINELASDGYSKLIAGDITVAGQLSLAGSQLEIESNGILSAATGISLTQGSVLTVPKADSNKKLLYPLRISTPGVVTIDATSKIDLTGKGYPAGYTVNFNQEQTWNAGSHGGDSGYYAGTDKEAAGAYGDFDKAMFPGGGGAAGNSVNGGGLLQLSTGTLALDGDIVANGTNYFSSSAGAGGGIHIDVTTLTGAGAIRANGSAARNDTSLSGAGGRISIYYADNTNFSGTYTAAGGDSVAMPQRRGGAGTHFFKQVGQPYGDLVIDNADLTVGTLVNGVERTLPQPTSLRSIGRHTITAVEPMGVDQWRITVEGQPWHAPIDSLDKLGITGLQVDLDASDQAGTLYEVVDNDQNSLTIQTPDDVASLVGTELIGVITVNTITVRGGANAVVKDRLVILDPVNSSVSDNAQLHVADMDQVSTETLLTDLGGGVLRFDSPFVLDSLTLTSSQYVFNGGLTVNGELSVSNGAALTALNLQATDVLLDGGILKTSNANIANALNMVNGAEISIPDDYTDGDASASLYLNVTGNITIDTSSTINLNGKYRSLELDILPTQVSSTHFRACHGGQSNRSVYYYIYSNTGFDCDYGSYAKAAYPGIASDLEAYGGGFAEIHANVITNNGVISANGAQGINGRHGGAGGGIHIAVNELTGTGSIEASGAGVASSDLNGGGGRISVNIATTDNFTGQYLVHGGNAAAAGTVYVTRPGDSYGSLTIDNNDVVSDYVTPIRHVGRHVIESATQLSGNLWRIAVGPELGVHIVETGTLVNNDSQSTVGYHRFTLQENRRVDIAANTTEFTANIVVLRDDNNDLSTATGVYQSGYMQSEVSLNLDPGTYVVAVGSSQLVYSEAISGSNDDSGAGSYQISIDTIDGGGTWTTSSGFNLNGLEVSLDAADANSSLYKIVATAEESIVVETADDLSSVVGNELVGVHTFETLQVINQGSVDFGLDRVVILNTANSAIDNATIKLGEADQTTLEYLVGYLGTSTLVVSGPVNANSIAISMGTVTFENALNLSGDFAVGGGTVVVNDVTANNILLDNTTLLAANLTINSDFIMLNGASVTVSDATISPEQIYGLTINVTGNLIIDPTSSINLDAKGYPTDRSGPDFSGLERRGCHAGNSAWVGKNCSYGDYQRARFAGSGGRQGKGGGVVEIFAGNIQLNGSITANGELATYGGAGGGIHIEASQLSGSGRIEANAQYYGSSGGRVSMYVADISGFSGTYQARSKTSNAFEDNGAAGTVFIKDPAQPYGSLIIENGRDVQTVDKTSIRSVGRHIINSVTDLGNNRWEIAVASDGEVYVDETGTLGTGQTDSVTYYYFTLAEPREVTIEILNRDFDANLYLFRYNGSVEPSYEIDHASAGESVLTSYLDAGAYVIAVGDTKMYQSDAANGTNSDAQAGGNYTIKVVDSTHRIKPTDLTIGLGAQGLWVDLDASSFDGTYYRIAESGTDTLVIDTTDDLSVYQGKELVGVHQFDKLVVQSGANVDFGDDKVIVNNLTESSFNGGTVTAGQINESWINTFSNDANTDNVIIRQPLSLGAAVISLDSIAFSGGLSVSGDVSIGSGASISTPNLAADNILLSGTGSQLTVDGVTASGQITVLNGAAVTTYPANKDTKTVHTLSINAGTTVTVDASSKIDVSYKGYDGLHVGPDYRYRRNEACHAGASSDYGLNGEADIGVDCSYGRYDMAQFAGSAMTNQGGGIVQIQASQLTVDGEVLANGAAQSAGGGIHIVAGQFNGTGSLQASGDADSYRTGGGGRISVYTDGPSEFTGAILASEKYRGYVSAGVGTIYLRDTTQPYGDLIIRGDTNDVNPRDNRLSTKIRNVGRHVITNVTDLGNNQWRISIGDDQSVNIRQQGFVLKSGSSSIDYYYFTLNKRSHVQIDIEHSSIDPDLYLLRDDGYLTADDLIDYERYSNYRGETSLGAVLDAGDYMVATGTSLSTTEVIDGYGSSSYGGKYTISITSNGTWRPSATPGLGLDGLLVDLDASDEAGPLYEIVSNSKESFVVESTNDLSALVGNELIGVHTLRTLTVDNRAAVNFGGDRVVLAEPENSHIGANSSLFVRELDAVSQDYLLANLGAGTLHFNGPVSFTNLSLPSGTLEFEQPLTLETLSAEGGSTVRALDLMVNALTASSATIVTQALSVAGDVSLTNNAMLTVPAADQDKQTIHGLNLVVAGTLSIDSTSSINASGKGFPGNYGGPDFVKNQGLGCHAGLYPGTTPANCSYGRFDNPLLAGSGNASYGIYEGAAGGGIISIDANAIINDGAIRANGGQGAYYRGGAAGGSIRVNVGTLSGLGQFETKGGPRTYSGYDGAGGRIAIEYSDNTGFSGNYYVQSSGTSTSGAGTVYLKNIAAAYGSMLVNNAGRTAQANSTPLRRVGRHTVTAVTDMQNGTYEVAVGPDDTVHRRITGVTSGTGYDAVHHHEFTLTSSHDVKIEVPEAAFNSHIYLFRLDGYNYTYIASNTGAGNTSTIVATLSPGDYVVAVGAYNLTQNEAIDRYNNSSTGAYTLLIDTTDGTWRASDSQYGWGVGDLEIDMNASDTVGPLYRILANRDNVLVVESQDDLTGMVGNELIGVQQFETLNVLGGAQLDFGADRVVVYDLLGSGIGASSAVTSSPDSTLP